MFDKEQSGRGLFTSLPHKFLENSFECAKAIRSNSNSLTKQMA